MKPPKSIEILIQTIRGYKVMIDADLATLYGVPTKSLNQAIKRNMERFPDDFIFRLTKEEKSRWSQIVTTLPGLNSPKPCRGRLPNMAP